MNTLNCVLSVTLICLIVLVLSSYKKLNYICTVLDEILNGNLNQRVRFQNHIAPLNLLCVKINNIIENFQNVNEKSKLAEESRKKMISNISHDLRTPLTSMLGYMELIINDPNLSNEEKNKYINIVYNKGNYLYNLMEEFFQISKLDSNDVKLDIKEINVSEIIRQSIVSFFNEIKKFNIEPQINIGDEDIYALGDEKALNRILSNLINNSLKYGEKKSALGINLTADINNVFIEVWDNGSGISQEDINYIFDRLYTAEKSRKLNLKSSGLGLTIVKKLVESLGGNISVQSIPFEKTVFKFNLPKAHSKKVKEFVRTE